MRSLILVVSFVLTSPVQANLLTIDFEGVVADDEIAGGLSSYVEDGMALMHTDTQAAIFGSDTVNNNTNGTAIFGWCNIDSGGFCVPGSSLNLSQEAGALFDLLSLDSSNLQTGMTPNDLLVTGYLSGGGTVQTTLNLAQDTWNTYTFDTSWTDLNYVTIEGADVGANLAIDNIVVSTVPVPAAVWLFCSALAGLGWMRRKQENLI